MDILLLDGAQGEGGGQILRSALTLSMITGIPFRIERIRAKRNKPGLLRQHLTAVNAAASICSARVSGNTAGSQTLEFMPGAVSGGDYRFDIGTAGSCTLVLQTVLPALWFAGHASTVTVRGGTHNFAAPPADFLMRSWLPLVQRMGVDMEIELVRHGFYPAGGGEVRATVQPSQALQPLELVTRGELLASKTIAVIAALPSEIAKRELAELSKHLADAEQEMRILSSREGPGNVAMIELRHARVTEVFTAFGEKGLPAEAVADRAAKLALHYLGTTAAVGEHLADQLLLPMALAGGGSFTTSSRSTHLDSNIQIIQKFLPVDFGVEHDGDAHRVSVQ